MVIEKDTDYVVELSSDMFHSDESEATSYDFFIESLLAHFKLHQQEDFACVIRYPGGTYSAISDSYMKAMSQDILLIDLAESVWKHRHTLILRALTQEGVQHIRKIISKARASKTLLEVNQEISLVVN